MTTANRPKTGAYLAGTAVIICFLFSATPAFALNAPTDFYGDSETDDSITWRWTDNTGIEDGFEIQNPTDESVAQAGTNEVSTVETGLAENTVYTRHCHAFQNLGGGIQNPQIGSGSVSGRYPLDIFYKFSRCQMLFNSAEIGTGGIIKKIRFDKNCIDTALICSSTIYMYETTDTQLTAWVGGDSGPGVEVFSRNIMNCDTGVGWFEIILDTPFPYSGLNSLIVTFRQQSNGYDTTYPTWNLETKTNRCMFAYSDTENPPISNMTLQPCLPNTQFEIDNTSLDLSPASNSDSSTTLVHEPGDADLALSDAGNRETQITVTPPMNDKTELTGVYIDRDSSPAFGSPVQISDWTQNYFQIDPVPSTGVWYYRIRFRNQNGVVTGTYNESVTITSQPILAPTGFYGDTETNDSITWRWTDQTSTENGFEIHVTGSEDIVLDVGENTEQAVEEGLDENTQYSRHAHAYEMTTGASGTYEITDTPLYYGYQLPIIVKDIAYYRCQMLYLKEEIGGEGIITKIRFFHYNNKGATINNVTIRMAEVENTTLTDWIGGDSGAGAEVYSGSLIVGTVPDVWVEITLHTPFYFNNYKNLLVTLRHQHGTSISSDMQWTAFLPTENRSLIGMSVSENPPPVTPEEAIPEVQFEITPASKNRSPASNDGSACTLVYDPADPDLNLIELDTGQVLIAVTPPRNYTAGFTSVYIDRDSSPGFGDPVLISDWTQIYNQADYPPDPGTWYYRISFRNQYGVVTGNYSESIVYTATPPGSPGDFSGVGSSESSIDWSWTDNSTEEGFSVHNASEIVKAVAGVDTTTTTESGLDENTIYTRHCHSYITAGIPADNVTLGTGVYIGYWPIDPWDTKYNRSQQLYLAGEMAKAGTINKIWFNKYDTGAVTINNARFLMDEVDQFDIFNWQGGPDGSGAEVFSGSLNLPSGTGWYQIDLTTPFNYSGTKNLLISFRHEHGVQEATQIRWLLSLAADRSLYGWSNTINPPDVGPTNAIPDVQFEIDTTAEVYSPASNGNSACTLVHDPDDADLLLSELTLGQVQIDVTPPPNPGAGNTGVYVDRDTSPAFGSPYTVMDWTQSYSFINIVPTAGLYYYRIKFRNQDGVETSTHNESITVTSDPPLPQEPTVLRSSGRVNPTSLGGPLTFSAKHTHPGLPVPATEAMIQVDDNQDFLSTHWDSGWSPISPVSPGTRSEEINYGGAQLAYGDRYYWRMKFINDVPQETPWSSEVRWFQLVEYWQELPYKGYHMLDIPCYTGGKTIGELIGDDMSLIWIFRYDEVTRDWVQGFAGDTFENNVGYFAYCNVPGEIPGFNGEYVDNTGDQSITLSWNNSGTYWDDGWNLVRNPYSQPVSWTTACTLQNCDDTQWRPWDGISMQYGLCQQGQPPGGCGSDTIPGGASFWVHAKGENAQIIITDPGPPPAPMPLPPQALQWRMLFSATTGSYADTATYISFREDGLKGYDPYDIFEMRPFATKYIQAFFDHPEWGYYAGKYTQDTRPFIAEGETETWNLTVHTTSASGYIALSWSVPEEIEGFWDLYLRDNTNGIVNDMSLSTSYDYPATDKDTREFSISATRLKASPFCDADLNGVVTENDAVVCARAEHNLETLTPEQRYLADMNGDGEIGIIDALIILRRLRGHLPKSP